MVVYFMEQDKVVRQAKVSKHDKINKICTFKSIIRGSIFLLLSSALQVISGKIFDSLPVHEWIAKKVSHH